MRTIGLVNCVGYAVMIDWLYLSAWDEFILEVHIPIKLKFSRMLHTLYGYVSIDDICGAAPNR